MATKFTFPFVLAGYCAVCLAGSLQAQDAPSPNAVDSNEELISLLPYPEGAYEARQELAQRVSGLGPAEVDAFADEFIKQCLSLPPDHPRRQVVVASTEIFPPAVSLRILESVLLVDPAPMDVNIFATSYAQAARVAPITEDLKIRYRDKLLELERRLRSGDFDENGDATWLYEPIYTGLGVCGDLAIDAMLDLPGLSDHVIHALSAMNTARSREELWQLVTEAKLERQYYLPLMGLVKNLSSISDADKKDAILDRVDQLLSSDDKIVKLGAARMAGESKDARFIPKLEEISRQDTSTFTRDTGGDAPPEEVFAVRREAQEALEKIRRNADN